MKRALWPRKFPATLAGDQGLARLMRGLFFYCPSVSYRVDLLPELRFDPRWRQVMDLDLYARISWVVVRSCSCPGTCTAIGATTAR